MYGYCTKVVGLSSTPGQKNAPTSTGQPGQVTTVVTLDLNVRVSADVFNVYQ